MHTCVLPSFNVLTQIIFEGVKDSKSFLNTLVSIFQDHEESLARMQPDVLLHDMIHRAAFRGNTVGLPKFCPKENVEKMQRDDLRSYLATYMQPERTVIAGVGKLFHANVSHVLKSV